jgi:peptidoglycan/xylan/chitin deacetylase (PgdA/CDA1 family)/glycosyltransferase involved in cell wall biosynthesis
MRFSIIIPTYQRRAVVTCNVAALDRQTFRDFEVIVVVDGSEDGSAQALRELALGFPLRVIEQPHAGRGRACNVGAAAASGEILLFLDDDMEAHPCLLAEHDRSQRRGAGVVLGDLPLHPQSPPNLLSWGVGFWASSRRERLTRRGAMIGPDDLVTGHMSVSRERFEHLGGFDHALTRAGLYGGEDIDFGTRVQQAGWSVIFNPYAISYQYYDVDPGEYLRREVEAGRSDQELLLKHPGRPDLARTLMFHTRRARWLLGPFVYAPEPLSRPLRSLAAALVRTGRHTARLRRLFFAVRTMEHKRGAHLASVAASRGCIRVLAYHAIADLRHDPVLEKYGVPPERFGAQLDDLTRHGWRFISLDDLLGALAGGRIPPERSVLVTFDDAYECLQTTACPILEERGIPAVAFAVAERVGETNEWDRPIGAGVMRLVDARGLRSISGRGIEIGSHAVTHRPLNTIGPDEFERELKGSADILEALGLPRPRVLAYPHGEWSPAVASAAREAGYRAAFTVTPGVVRTGSDPWTLSRVEVVSEDQPWQLRLKLAQAAAPARWRAWVLEQVSRRRARSLTRLLRLASPRQIARCAERRFLAAPAWRPREERSLVRRWRREARATRPSRRVERLRRERPGSRP